MTSRRAKSATTMSVLCLILVVMAWWGIRNATAPIASGPASAHPSCSAAETYTKKFVKPADVTVSVYNAGARSGFAALTLQRLEDRGFIPGEVANAPAELTSRPVRKARVLTTTADDTRAQLVARTLGARVEVQVTTEPLGPGVDVLVGKHMGLLNRHAPARLKLPEPDVSCVKVD